MIVNRYKEKESKKYVIADLSDKTNYLISNKNGMYSFIDNIVTCTKFVNKNVAEQICNECMLITSIPLVVIPIIITYEIIEEN